MLWQEHNNQPQLLGSLLSFSLYKRQQGRVARQVTFAAVAIAIAIGVWRLAQLLPLWLGGDATSSLSSDELGIVRFLVPGVLLAVGIWVSFRMVNTPSIADFLIAVETEMTKVSWPTRDEGHPQLNRDYFPDLHTRRNFSRVRSFLVVCPSCPSRLGIH